MRDPFVKVISCFNWRCALPWLLERGKLITCRMVDQARKNSDCFSYEINPSLTKTLMFLAVGSLQLVPMY